MVVCLWWCFCGGVFVVVFLWRCFCGGVFVVVLLWWCVCGGVFVVVFLWWCFCGGVFVVVFLWWCLCGVFVVVFLWCFCGGHLKIFRLRLPQNIFFNTKPQIHLKKCLAQSRRETTPSWDYDISQSVTPFVKNALSLQKVSQTARNPQTLKPPNGPQNLIWLLFFRGWGFEGGGFENLWRKLEASESGSTRHQFCIMVASCPSLRCSWKKKNNSRMQRSKGFGHGVVVANI